MTRETVFEFLTLSAFFAIAATLGSVLSCLPA